MKVFFDTKNFYYLPQYLPLYIELEKRGHECRLVCYGKTLEKQVSEYQFEGIEPDLACVEDEEGALQVYQSEEPDWIIFGNRNQYLAQIHQFSQTVQLGHGIGPKPSYYRKSGTPMTVRFIEGAQRIQKIREMYPDQNFVQVGYCKLDPLFNGEQPGLDFEAIGFSRERPCLLYAPTFNPSSLECFPDNWPQDFSEYNILIKPHSFTYEKNEYRGQRKKLKRWAAHDNVYVAGMDEVSLLPFMKEADILISEASSTLFEFVALDKPVIVCDFFKLKWFYRGPFHYRFKKRFGKDNVLYQDIGRHIGRFSELPRAVAEELAHPEHYRENRRRYTRDHVGPTDGRASARIVDYLEKHCIPESA